MPKVTIVIPCYNYAHYIPEAIQSILNQTVPCETVIVNDGSTDNLEEVLKKFYNLTPPITYVKQQNKGLAAARNAGIAEAQTEWVLPLDADDKLDEECVEKLLEKADKADILVPGQQTFGDNSMFLSHSHKEFSYQAFRSGNQCHCSCLYRKSMWQKLGGYDENMKLGYEDWEFWIRAAENGYTFAAVDEPLFYYRKHGKTMVANASAHQTEIVNYINSKHS